CVGCKACRNECPTGVDMARMKIEVQHQRVRVQGLSFRDRLIGNLPRLAPMARWLRHLLNLRDVVPGLPWMTERLFGLAAARPLPHWQRPYQDAGRPAVPGDIVGDGRDVILFADTFNRYFERKNLE